MNWCRLRVWRKNVNVICIAFEVDRDWMVMECRFSNFWPEEMRLCDFGRRFMASRGGGDLYISVMWHGGEGLVSASFFMYRFPPHICVLFFRETAACLSHLWVCSCEVVDFTGEFMCSCRSTSVCACEIVDFVEFVCIILSLTSVNFFFTWNCRVHLWVCPCKIFAHFVGSCEIFSELVRIKFSLTSVSLFV
jgi:hypothetical protein